MPATDRIASKAAHQMADILIDNVSEVDEVIIGTPQELHRPQSVISVVKVYVRVGEQFREHLAIPTSVLYRLLDHLVRATRPQEPVPARSADEDIESALINLHQGTETQKRKAPRALRVVGDYARGNGTLVPVEITWWADNTIRIRYRGASGL